MATVTELLQGGSGSGINIQGGGSNSGRVAQNTIPISTLQPTADINFYQPAVSGSAVESTNVGGGGGSTATPAATVDPYAGTIFGSTSGYNAALQNYNSAKDSTMNSITDAIGTSGNKYNSSILDYLDSRRQQQNTIDSNSTQNLLAKLSGMQSIMDMVGNGVQSSGVLLANKNAGSSSGGDAIARAYGTLGRQQASTVGNQFAQGQDKINTDQTNLGIADAIQTRHSQEDKTNTINDIVNSARTQLAALNQNAVYASLPDQINIEAKIAEIKQQALEALSKYDSVLSGGIAGQSPMSSDTVRANATRLLTSGVAPESEFNYTSEFPAQFQGTGQFASSLPIFISPSSRKQTV